MMATERITDLQTRLQRSRAALEALAGRAAALRAQLAEAAPAPASPSPPRNELPLAAALDRLSHQTVAPLPVTARDEDDGRLISDAWEIALIDVEGK